MGGVEEPGGGRWERVGQTLLEETQGVGGGRDTNNEDDLWRKG